MRTAVQRSDGTIEISRKIEQAHVDLERYLRLKSGENFIDIAEADNVMVETVQTSCKRGRSMFEGQQLLEIRDLKHDGIIETERIRAEIRAETKELLKQAVVELLEGKRTVVECNKITGQVTLHTYKDPEVIAMGIEHAMKAISLVEKPTPNQTIVQIQQNSFGNEGQTSREGSFEERLARIRKKQIGRSEASDNHVIETTAINVTDSEPIPTESSEPEGDWKF